MLPDSAGEGHLPLDNFSAFYPLLPHSNIRRQVTVISFSPALDFLDAAYRTEDNSDTPLLGRRQDPDLLGEVV